MLFSYHCLSLDCQGTSLLLLLKWLIKECLWQFDGSLSDGHARTVSCLSRWNELSIPSKITFDLAGGDHGRPQGGGSGEKKHQIMFQFMLKKPLSHTHSHTPCWQLISFLCGTGQGFLLEIFTWYIFVGTFAWSCETNNQSALLSQVNKAVQMCQILNQSGESLVSVTFEFSANV